MESLSSSHFTKIKNFLDAQTNFLDEVREIIYQVSGVNLAPTELVWRPPTLTIKSSPTARNLIFRHREKILALLTDRFDRQAPKLIR
jgi:hypothetical protein